MSLIDLAAGLSRARRWWRTQSRRRQAVYIAVASSLILIPLHLSRHTGAASPEGEAQHPYTSAAVEPPLGPRLAGLGSQRSDHPQPAPTPQGPILTYTIQQGDTLSAIAARFGTSVLSLEVANDLGDHSILQPGQKLTVLTLVGWVHTVQRGETLSGIAAAGGVTVDQLAAANHLSVDAILHPGLRLVVPAEPRPPSGQNSPAAPSRRSPAPSTSAATRLQWPLSGPITSPFGWRRDPITGASELHSGIDIAAPWGTPVHAAAAGYVQYAGWDGGYGYAVILDHGGGLQTLYAHNSRLLVHPGQAVSAGQVIALVGATGHATGPHCHFGVYVNGSPVNPMGYLP